MNIFLKKYISIYTVRKGNKTKYYLWYVGVDPQRNKMIRIGSTLMREVIKEAISKPRPIYLEPRTVGIIIAFTF